jgi:hypothetical protein
MFNQYHGFAMATRSLLEAIQDRTGNRLSLNVARNPHKLFRMAGHTAAWAQQHLRHGVALEAHPNGIGPSMTQILSTAFKVGNKEFWDEEMARSFGDYLIARTVIQRFIRFKPELRSGR